MTNKYDIFISYKRKSLPTANNLYYRLTTRGYYTFFDLEEMRRDNFNVQLLNYIENAKDVFVILEEGSLDACRREDWEKDWFCHEIAFALEKKKNIIPILLNGYKMPQEEFFPDKLKELSLKDAPEFNFSFFEAYLDKLVEKEYLISKPNLQDKAISVFKFYSNEDCQVFKEGKLVCSLEGMSDVPYYLPVSRKGDYRFKAINDRTAVQRVLKEVIDSAEEKEIEIRWGSHLQTDDNTEGCVNEGNDKRDVFLCHSIYDIKIVKELIALFEKNHITYFDDKEATIQSEGLDCDSLLKRRIMGAKVIVFLSSEHSAKSDNVKPELRFAMRCHKPLIVLKLDTTPYPSEFAGYLNFSPKIDTTFYNRSVEKTLIELITCRL